MAEVTYYFNSRSTGNWTDPDNMIDGSIETFASTNATGTIETLDGNTCPGDELGTLTDAEIRAYGYGDGDDQIRAFLDGKATGALTMPSSPDWTPYTSIYHVWQTFLGHAPTFADVVDLDCGVEFVKVAKANTMHCAKVEIRVTYWTTPVADIDVGAAPLDRSDSASLGYTYVDKDNPANASGTLHSVKVYAYENISGLIVGTFYATNGNTLKCRDSVSIGDVEAGAERTFSGLSIAVQEGDYIGCYYTAGKIKRGMVGVAGQWYVSGEYIDPNDETDYTFDANSIISLYGYGDVGVGGYYHGLKVQGVGELALADVGSHPLRIRKGGTTYGIELVATDDPDASAIRIKTGTGIKAIRKYT